MRASQRLYNYWRILLAQIFLMGLTALMTENVLLYIFFAIALLGIFGSIIIDIWKTGLTRWLAIASGCIALLSGLYWAIPGVTEQGAQIAFTVCAFAYAVFILIAIISIGRNIFTSEHISLNCIIGSICVYLLIGMFFAFCFAGLDLIHPDAISFGEEHVQSIGSFQDYLYFSYTTLTTLGYGDIVPHIPLSRLLANLEAISGSLYLVIMVARLVSIHISQSARRRHDG